MVAKHLAFECTASKMLRTLLTITCSLVCFSFHWLNLSQVLTENRNMDQASSCPLGATETGGRTAFRDGVVCWEGGRCDTHRVMTHIWQGGGEIRKTFRRIECVVAEEGGACLVYTEPWVQPLAC